MWVALGLALAPGLLGAATAESLFEKGTTAYKAGDFAAARGAFEAATREHPTSGTLLNLGNADWQRGDTGAAILAWERARWLNPFGKGAKENLRFVRGVAQLESPQLRWYEVVSSWLPANWWACVAGVSLWFAVAIGVLPGILRWRRATWHQAASACGLAVFLLSVPAHFGVLTRARIGIVLQKDTPLRLTPTQEAEVVTRMAAGEPVRVGKERGRFVLVRGNRGFGWVEKEQVGRLSP